MPDRREEEIGRGAWIQRNRIGSSVSFLIVVFLLALPCASTASPVAGREKQQSERTNVTTKWEERLKQQQKESFSSSV